MSHALLIELLKAVLPTLLLLVGGQWLLGRYDLVKKRAEQEIELARTIRTKQYELSFEIFQRFAELMALFREINTSVNYPNDKVELNNFLKRAIASEAQVDALILRISCEYGAESEEELEALLGHMRQSTQLWRESIRKGERLPFKDSHQADYLRFKETFGAVAALVIQRIHNNKVVPAAHTKKVRDLLVKVFSNKYENATYVPIQSRADWVRDVKQSK